MRRDEGEAVKVRLVEGRKCGGGKDGVLRAANALKKLTAIKRELQTSLAIHSDASRLFHHNRFI